MKELPNENPTVFLSYCRADKDRVVPYYDFLHSKGINVWMDIKNLKAGQNWDFEIKRALEKSRLVIVFLSDHAIDHRGYAQREIKIALAHAETKLVDDIFIIPILLDDAATIPERLRSVQAVRASESNCYDSVLDAIIHQTERLGESVSDAQGQSNVWWSRVKYRDSWDGLPGYVADFEVLKFSSELYPQVGEITDVLRGNLVSRVMNERGVMLSGQMSDHFNFGQERHRRTNTWEAFCGEPIIQGKVISLLYSIHWYGAGAAHPNQNFVSFTFLLDPIIQIGLPTQIFENADDALARIQTIVRKKLLAAKDADDDSYELDTEWVSEGTKDWDCYHAFVFDEDGIEFAFAPYQVAAYAFGPHFVKVNYSDISDLMGDHWKYALDLQ